MKNKGSGAWLVRYTLMFLAVLLPTVACLLLAGKTYLWKVDAYYQHYTALSYTGNLVRSLLAGEGFPMVDFSLGQGFDTITTLAYYGLFNPLEWLAAFFTGDGLEVYYHVLTFGYMYLSGLLLCAYLRMMGFGGKDKWTLPISGLLFAYCGYNAIAILKHPYFANGSIYLILLLICVERVFRGRSSILMSVVTALMLAANFYFAFQTTLLVVMYIIIRLAFRLKREGIARSAKQGFSLLGSYVLGFLMSMAVLLPVIIAFLDSGRTSLVGGYTDSLLHYTPGYYLNLVLLFCAPYDYAGYWSLQNFSPLAVFAAILLFSRNDSRDLRAGNEKNQLRAGFAVALICLCVPLAGKVFNGLGYVANRWSYGWAFIVCTMTAWALPKILSEEFSGRKKMALIGFAWAAVMIAFGLIAHKIPLLNDGGNSDGVGGMNLRTKNIALLAGGAALAGSSLALLLLDKPLRMKREKALRAFAMLTTLCCLAYNVGYGVMTFVDDDFYEKDIDRKISEQTAAEAQKFAGDGFFRADTGMWLDAHAALLDYNGLGYYWSIIPSCVSGHAMDLQLSSLQYPFRQMGLGSDSYLSALASVGCSLRNAQDRVVVPQGGEYVGNVLQADGQTVETYRNSLMLPMGYLFTQTMAEADYAALSPVEKRQALVSCAVLESPDEGDAAFAPDFRMEEIEWEITDTKDVEAEGLSFRAKKGGTITLRVQGLPDSETYLVVGAPEVRYSSGENDALIYARSDNGVNGMYFIRPESIFAYDQQGSCMNLGYSDSGFCEIDLRFRDDADIAFSDMKLYSVPASYLEEAVERIRSRGVWEPTVENNRVWGSANFTQDGILQAAIPYSSGWSCTVDGEKVPVERCGGMYMGVRVGAGAHEIEFSYVTPGLKAGAMISLAAVALALVVQAALRLRRRRLARRI